MKQTKLFLASLLAITIIAFASLVANPALAGEKVASGTFVGKSDHITSGTVTIKKYGDKYVVYLGDDFSLDGAPAPTVGFGTNGKFDKATDFAKLKSISGKQKYELPANIDVSAYNEFYIWCRDFSVPLGVAKLN